jgi:hypothetical protein
MLGATSRVVDLARLSFALAIAGLALACPADAVAGAQMLASPASAVTSAQIISVINAERHGNGLPLLHEDPSLSAGCAAYDNYRRLNGSVQDGFTPGPEERSKPGYTAAGARASRDSLLNAGDRPADSWANGDVFDDAPGHLFQLMNPDLAVIGVDQLEVNLGPFFGTAYISCIDTRSARYRPRSRRPRLYTYVGPNGTTPVHPPAYREGPSVQGALIFVYFDGPKRATVTLRLLTLRYPDRAVRQPAYTLLTGGLRDGRKARRARASRKPTGKFSSPQPSTVIEVGPPVGEGPYKLKTIYEYQEPGHRLVYSTTVPFSATVYGQ